MEDLTERQRQVLEVLSRRIEQDGFPPTVREIGEEVGLSSPASVQTHLTALEQKGYIKRRASKRRALELVRDDSLGPVVGADSAVRLPLVGRIAAGSPLLAEENVDELVDVPSFLCGSGESFVLRVKGSSMEGAGILDGDLVVVRRQEHAENGDIVVALLDDEATLKRFFREEERIRLQPENPAMAPIFARNPRIVGKVVSVMRKL